ncbi:MAG: Flp pilus assembly complex ATPase component TadA [Myxococcales bacterium]|nr:Flp pilus assembly complex ATPase component TadA [Myxococcales bacterium]
MFTVAITEKGGAQRQVTFDKAEVTIGRVQGNDIILPKGNVSKRHARIVLKDGRFIVVDLKSTNGTYVNGRKITSPLVVKSGDKVYVGDFILTLEESQNAQEPVDAPDDALGATGNPAAMEPPPMEAPPAPAPPPRAPSAAPPPLPFAPPPGAGGPPSNPQSGLSESDGIAEAAEPPTVDPEIKPALPPLDEDASSSVASIPSARIPLEREPAPPAFAPTGAPPALTSSGDPFGPSGRSIPDPVPPMPSNVPAERPSEPAFHQPPTAAKAKAPGGSSPPRGDGPGTAPTRGLAEPAPPVAPVGVSKTDRSALRAVMGHLASVFDTTVIEAGSLHDGERRASAKAAIGEVLTHLRTSGSIDVPSTKSIAEAAEREAVGLGALEALLADSAVREIIVEEPGRVMVDHGEGLRSTDLFFSSGQALRTIALRLVTQGGGHPRTEESVYEGTLPYGPKFTVILPPVAVRGPVIEIRRVSGAPSADDLVAEGMLNTEMVELLHRAILARRNILVFGPIGSGVTTVLGAVAGLIDQSQRIITVEDSPDLHLEHDHVISLAVGSRLGGASLANLVKQATTLRGDRLIVDDIRGPGLATILHEIVARPPGNLLGIHGQGGAPLEWLCSVAQGGATEGSPSELVAQAVHVLIEMGRDGDQTFVERISEVKPTKDGSPKASALFAYEKGAFATKGSPSFSG